jgi:glycosyltransferase involved in cell wall biosynthesis
MNEIAFVVPGALDQLTGGYLFDRHIVDGLRARGRAVRVIELESTPAAAAFAAFPEGQAVAIDALAFPDMTESLHACATRLRVVAFVHHPLADETGLSPAEARRMATLEAAMLPHCRGVLCASRLTAATVTAYGIPADRIAVTYPGTAKPDIPPARRDRPVRRLLCVGNVIPRKGYRVLIDALTQLRDLDWQLDCIGSLNRDPDEAQRLRKQIESAGLGDRISLRGEQPPAAVAAAYSSADAFVLATHHEGYGMVCAEAMAHGLPQIVTAAGAVPEVVPPEAGLLVPAGDPAALAEALRWLIADPALAGRLAAGARATAVRLPDWPEAVAGWKTEFDRLASLPPLRPGSHVVPLCGDDPRAMRG